MEGGEIGLVNKDRFNCPGASVTLTGVTGDNVEDFDRYSGAGRHDGTANGMSEASAVVTLPVSALTVSFNLHELAYIVKQSAGNKMIVIDGVW